MMKDTGIFTGITLMAFTILIRPLPAFAQVPANEEITEVVDTESLQDQDEKDTTRLAGVRTISFYLMNDRPVSGRLISEDKSQITVEELDESKIFISTYSKKEINSRTIRQTKMPEVKYYLDLAEYFESRIWDFKDDPDDFTQAIRFYEKAKEIIEQSQVRIPTSAAEIEEKIRQLHEQKNLWTENVKTRAELKRLEFEATFDVRLEELDDKIDGLAQSLREMGQQFDRFAKSTQDNYNKFKGSVSRINQTFSSRFEELKTRIELNEREIDRLWRRRYRYYPRYYYRLPQRDDDSSEQ
jgi:membrane-bound lytic murein transglycosylase